MNDRLTNRKARPNRWRVNHSVRGFDPPDDADELLESLLDDGGPEPERERQAVPAVSVPDDDPQLIAAVGEAKSRFSEFVAAFAGRGEADQFAVKAAFLDDYGREFLWLTVTAVDARHIFGTLDNDPCLVRAVRRGQPVRVPLAGLNDWLYTRGGERVGGFTVGVLEQRRRGEAA